MGVGEGITYLLPATLDRIVSGGMIAREEGERKRKGSGKEMERLRK